jgi:protein SCO1/2
MVFLFAVLAFGNGKGHWLRKEASEPAPEFELTDQDGKKVTLQNSNGTVRIVSFIFTYCPTGCPIATAKLVDVQKAFRGKPLHLVSISIDPDHDTPDALKEYAQRMGADLRNWSFLTGTKDEIDRVRIAYGIPMERKARRGPNGEIVSIGISDHGMKTFVLDPSGRKRWEYWGQDFDTKAVTKDLMTLLAAVGK